MTTSSPSALSLLEQSRLQKGEILTQSRLYSWWGGRVTAQIYLPQLRSLVWEALTDYDRWVDIFPHITQSEVIESLSPFRKRLYQAAEKNFSLMTIAVHAELMVREYPQRRIWFVLEKPNRCFREFEAEVWLREVSPGVGTFLSYTVQAAASLPIPAPFIQEAMRQDLPQNLAHLRSYLKEL
jgi:hypothetical protein